MKTFKYILGLALLFLSTSLWATHNKAGEITYKRLSGLTYEITITTYTDPNSDQADRCELPIRFGDGQFDTVPRINGPGSPDCLHSGEILNAKLKKNIYRGIHTYAGNGTYEITMEDPNRIEGIRNIPQSVGIPFFLKSTLVIHPLLGSNSSPELTIPPIDDACICQPFYHNPGAVDPDGDSLSYQISVCFGDNGNEIPGYTTPRPSSSPGCGNQIFNIDPYTGTLTWDAPGLNGIFNVCILITEWRKRRVPNQPVVWDSVGNVLRDMQVEVGLCNNTPPNFLPIPPICVIAGDTIDQTITAFDRGQTIELTATGEPISLTNSPASATPNPHRNRDTVKMNFNWATQCSHVRNSSYLMQFKAKDNDSQVALTRFATFQIDVVGPPVENLVTTPDKNSIEVSWDANFCGNISRYDVYRKVDSTNWTPYTCETGLPSYLGYTLVGSVNGHTNTVFNDDNNGVGLFHGVTYCYRVVAVFGNGAESIASEEVCNELPFNTPIITMNSVWNTDNSVGLDTVSFAKPQEIDLTVYTPPYSFKVFELDGTGSREVYASGTYTTWTSIDTLVEINNLNTVDQDHTFKVIMYSGSTEIGETHWASSVFLKINPDDRKLHLVWEESVPWANFEYVVFKDVGGTFQILDTVSTQTFTDTGLVNGDDYTYYVQSIGKYSITELPDSIYNNSQVVTGTPIDTIPPCPPAKPSIESECELFTNQISWSNPNEDDSCEYQDAVAYNLYFTPTLRDSYELIRSFSDINDTLVLFEDLQSVAGCYSVTAIDSFDNESALSTRVCVDNCPLYELPNVFTPGGDGFNDLFTPIFPYRYVKDIDMTIYNRWGQVMFETNDPDIRWDGKQMNSNLQVPSGVYFYICTVNEIRLSGIIPRELKGHITVINEENPVPSSD